MRCRTKPVEVEAFRVTDGEWPQWAEDAFNDGIITRHRGQLIVQTVDGDFMANEDDYIIRNAQGEFHPCSPDIFSETYEEVDA